MYKFDTHVKIWKNKIKTEYYLQKKKKKNYMHIEYEERISSDIEGCVCFQCQQNQKLTDKTFQESK